VLSALDDLAGGLRAAAPGSPQEQAEACRLVLGTQHGFAGDRQQYDHPRNAMLDSVLERRRGLPILLSVIYVEVARRAGSALAGVGLPGHFVVAHFAAEPPVVLDPFAGGRDVSGEVRQSDLRPWGAHETALRILNNLVRSFAVRSQLAEAIHAAELRLAFALEPDAHEALTSELQGLRARLN